MPSQLAPGDPNQPALITVAGVWTYGSLSNLRDRIARRLHALLHPREPCALSMGAVGPSVASLLATITSRRPVVLLPRSLRPEEVRTALDDCGVRLLLAPGTGGGLDPPALAEDWRFVDEADGLAYVMRETARSEGRLEELAKGWLLCQLTSGSTGRSRLAVRRGAAAVLEAASVQHHLALTAQDTVLVTSSLAHSYALCGGLLGALRAGACVAAAADVQETVTLAARARPSVLFGLAAGYQALMEAGESDVLTRTRLALSAGAPLPSGLFERFERWCGIPIRQDYGTTETGTIALDLGEPPAPETVGRPLQHVTVRLRPPLHATPGPGEQGEILVRSTATADWYVHDGRAVDCCDREGWYRTGDAGSWDGSGRLQVGRRLRPPVVTRAGVVDLDTVERVALTMPAVEEAVAVPVYDESDEASVRLIVVAPGTSAEVVRAWCAAHLALHEIPSSVERHSALPRSPAGKILGKYL